MTTQEELIEQIENLFADFRYIGEILATIKSHEFSKIEEVISYFHNLWEITEKLTDEELKKKEEEHIDINPGGHAQMVVRGKKVTFNIDKVIDSLRSQERYIEEILSALKKKFPKKFPKGSRFNQVEHTP